MDEGNEAQKGEGVAQHDPADQEVWFKQDLNPGFYIHTRACTRTHRAQLPLQLIPDSRSRERGLVKQKIQAQNWMISCRRP